MGTRSYKFFAEGQNSQTREAKICPINNLRVNDFAAQDGVVILLTLFYILSRNVFSEIGFSKLVVHYGLGKNDLYMKVFFRFIPKYHTMVICFFLESGFTRKTTMIRTIHIGIEIVERGMRSVDRYFSDPL